MNDDNVLNGSQPQSLPHWASITQVSMFLNVPREAIRSVVRRAVFNQERWVRKELSIDGKVVYLIDTTHQTYMAHEERWRQSKAMRETFSSFRQGGRSGYGQSILARSLSEEFALFPAASASRQPDRDAIGLSHWTHLRQWLYESDVQVFKNALEEEWEYPWHWRWGDLYGDGYQSLEEAILAALQSRFNRAEEAYDEHTRRPRFRFFRKRNDSHLA